jgi:hypothetical protein
MVAVVRSLRGPAQPGLIVPLALAGWEAAQSRRSGGGKDTWRRITGLEPEMENSPQITRMEFV